jgi:cytochrome c553
MKKAISFIITFTVAILIVVVVLLMTGPRMRFQPSVQAFEKRMAYPPENIISFDHSIFDTTSLVIPPDVEGNVITGRTYYEYYCTFCHGAEGNGNGEVGKSYVPKPSDLSRGSFSEISPGKFYRASFTGTGHSPVLERVIPFEYRPYILLYVRHKFR